MRIFLDTNVLVSAFATRGLCSDVLRETLSHHLLIISHPLLSEPKRILSEKMGLPEKLVCESLDFIKHSGQMSDVSNGPDISITDKDDIPIIHSALNGNADLFVTGDKEILKLKVVENMMIVGPRSFWELLKSHSV